MSSLDFEIEQKVFRDYYNQQLSLFKEAAKSFSTLVELLLTDNSNFDTPRVISRVKEREECIRKFERKHLKTLEKDKVPYTIEKYITDIIGLRIITFYETDIELIEEILESNFDIIEITDKTEILESKDDVFGYKGLHLDLKLNKIRVQLPEYTRINNFQFEVQIRTIAQDAWSVIDHKIKYKRNIPHLLKRRINRLAALFELADQEFVNIHRETIEFEERAKDLKESNGTKDENDLSGINKLDTFSFIKIMHEVFPNYDFYGRKIDGFIDELNNNNNLNITADFLRRSLKTNERLLDEYKKYQYEHFFNNLNPYTIIRHALYLADKERNELLLFDRQKSTFDKWLEKRENTNSNNING